MLADLPKDGKPVEADDDPHRLARVFILGYEGDLCRPTADVLPECITRRFWREEMYSWEQSLYRRLPEKEMRALLTRGVKKEFNRINLEKLKEFREKVKRAVQDGRKPPKKPPEALRVTSRLMADVQQALSSICLLPSIVEPPHWISGSGPFPAHEILAARNCLVHLPTLVSGRKDYQAPLTLDMFNLNALDYDFEHQAAPPIVWLEFMEQLWRGDIESVRCLQEWMGYFLTPDTRQQKILTIVGPKRSGKGTIARVIRRLIGAANIAGPTLASLGINFGLMPLLGKTVAIISDARLSHRVDLASITERLLSISGEDTLTVDRKHLPPVTTKLPTRLVLMTNELPDLKDSSGALASRFVLLNLTRSWYGREDKALTDKLMLELPGILLWAIDGWKRLQERGRFEQPKSGKELLGEMAALSSPVSQFVEECCTLNPNDEVARADLFECWSAWAKKVGMRPGTAPVFGRNLRAAFGTGNPLPACSVPVPDGIACSGLGGTQSSDGGIRVRKYQGIGLNEAGKVLLAQAKEQDAQARNRHGTGNGKSAFVGTA